LSQLRLNHLPGVLDMAMPGFSDMVTLAHAGMILSFRRIDFIPIRTLKLYPSRLSIMGKFSGHSVLKALNTFRRPDALELRLMDIGVDEIGRVDPMEPLTEILNVMIHTNFGHVCVIKPNTADLEIVGTVSLRSLVMYAPSLGPSFGLNENLNVEGFSSPLLEAAPEATLDEVVQIMLTKGVRRLAIRGSSQHPETVMVDDRIISQHVFSSTGFAAWKESPEKFFKTRVEELQLAQPGIVSSKLSLLAAWSMIYLNKAECLIVDNNKILTPWDIIIKPYMRMKQSIPSH